MKVSIITATYNSADTLLDTLHSLDYQTYTDIEYIVVDGGSTDDTVSIINQNCSRLSKIISEPDKGIYDALNKGIGLATGDIIGFLHSDDMLAYPDAIKDLVDTLNLTKACAIYADLDYVSRADTTRVVRKWISGNYDRTKLRYGWMPPHPTFFMKKDLYHKHGLFDLNFKIAADYDSLLRYLWKNQIRAAYLPKVVTKMRLGGMSNQNLKSVVKKTKEDIQALKNNHIFWPTALLIKNSSKIIQFVRR